MTAAFGGTDAEGRWTQRDSFEILEHALALHVAKQPYPLADIAGVTHAAALMERLPTQTVRSEEQIELQQFSTPIDIGALAAVMAAIGPDDIVLEPSAGNGLLAVQVPHHAGLQLNEIDPRRRERLASVFPNAIIKVALQLHARPWMDEQGQPIPRLELQRPCRREYIGENDLLESAWDVIDRATFETKWAEEVAELAGQTEVETIRLATGLLLPIWSALPSDHLAVNRIVDGQGNSWLGRLVFDQHVVQLYTKLGIAKSEDLPVEAIAHSVLSGRSVDVVRPFEMTIRRSFVNGAQRIEIERAPAQQLAYLKALGCFTEIIAYRTRVFVPVGEASTILEKLLKVA
ncbi:hypothetical protein V3I01_17925 (plasmid) [Sphingomonas sp. gentR]|uniref:hypothetical protein n=1 Tax=Sphingomonas sp. gentR TaxID=3118768 RepID=UPI0030D367F2